MKVIGLKQRNRKMNQSTDISAAIILCAGLGTRLKPWTDKHPKALAPVNGISLLERNTRWLQSFGINHVVVNVHHFADQIVDAVEGNNGWGSNVIISDERDAVLETGGGLLKAAPLLRQYNHFVLMNVDILTNLRLDLMIEQHIQSGALATLATTNRNTSRYLLFDSNKKLGGWINTKSGEEKIINANLPLNKNAFSGVHVISSAIFEYINLQGKFSMIDLYLDLCSKHSIYCFDHSNDLFIDVGKPESIAEAERMFQ